jgi:hypothetical protein
MLTVLGKFIEGARNGSFLTPLIRRIQLPRERAPWMCRPKIDSKIGKSFDIPPKPGNSRRMLPLPSASKCPSKKEPSPRFPRTGSAAIICLVPNDLDSTHELVAQIE